MAAAANAVIMGSALLGGAVSMYGQKKMADAQAKAEKLRERQMNLQAQRERRDAIRQSIIARSTALAQTTAQGASAPGSSGLAGAYGQIGGDVGRNILAINQNQKIGQGIFAANRDYYAGGIIQGFGTAIAGAGKATGDYLSTTA